MVLAAKIETFVDIPEGVNVEIDRSTVKVSGPKGSTQETFKLGPIKLEKVANQVKISVNFPKKMQKAMIGTIAGKIKNMITGVSKGYEYQLQINYAHFPMTVSVEGTKIVIKNFLGEKHPRTSKIVGNTQVKIKGQEITITGINKEEVGQTAANLVQTTKVRKKDQRVFKDGIFVTEKRVVENE
ncbi:MAG: 50S ribosomal protein L6 [Candidatus Diapherotrites archaeon]|nr:50S ribosomal protein L6 [Candidatus Diapherotrites archaeon]